MTKRTFGVIGLAVMGENLALNVESRGFPIAVYNRTASKTKEFMETRAVGKDVKAAYSLEEFVQILERPRKILVMVKAGPPVDAVIEQLKPLLEEGDMIIDGGNSLYEDTERRTRDLESTTKLGFVGMGVSGGEEGALHGPSLMPGGTEFAYRELEPILTKIAAQVDDGPCVTYVGSGGAGHYVKMVHNGIEYGDMQLIAEAYDVLKNGLGLSNQQLQETFAEWNRTDELNSYLIEITADIFKYVDPETGHHLVDLILDSAGQKGTGRWTVLSSLELGVSIPTIYAAVNARVMSAYKDERVAAAKELPGPGETYPGDAALFVDKVRDALYCSKMCSYAQGMALIAKASQEFNYNISLPESARIWKGGCIIRAGFLDKIRKAFAENPGLPNLLLAPEFKQSILDRQEAWREVLVLANKLGIPVPAFSSSLDYFDSYRRANLPQNLTQAQRDYFGAHTYERTDKPRGEFFHTEWMTGL
ncbi:MAG: decarboxylating NADP(+)-dependent phosphogluconate dehydrogenase [Microcystis aeruginosa Ma_QC_Ch_20071001_S25]|jgi:6-phosphogluconate dehydrogenase|uniref:6-phosphogluconate dehydrogenase, decarboxylating n=1 Tax=Microcystis aeruginosa Ma_QC_Ch_20071001_S25D TaxID=2486250 RepID=A0A552FSG8_MICAE|nr:MULTISPECIES: decarboxylating NADP(+)-dependent phosphogluconate dehydrogenase [unclassified Microcystis]MCA2765100.1 decarboxylating NADP(+)-dependent phosphogluconate dehydrogenase [Microcystis sp. M151S2]TRU48794.1 MAG: decarboxylating NADP(+)-dependent phosphogluconate dehydrogenase [Microcystis aeruginosa Ma_QC_Ch_20071001_S25]TRU49649.1 MAG: decarboxylating NADP(+)-dependent phosphogluconate dehydrogenase [Microcystis aeruginosa Ma_QC_Ch_20071001_S25D]TRU58241.1 MAG: decarboxylating NA